MQVDTIPLSLYVHIPWCVQKCPYCDFNSHKLNIAVDEIAYVRHLIADFMIDYQLNPRPIHSVFIGGGTPSLFAGESIDFLLKEIRGYADFEDNAEITLEANPGAFEQDKFCAYYQSGVNRLSLGIQSFDPQQLKILGRIHSSDEAHQAIMSAQKAGFTRINTDLMYGLSQQCVEAAMKDIQTALDYGCEHLSWYQLTLEPNTPFYTKPPVLPSDDEKQDIFEAGAILLETAGFVQYETSAWTRGQPSAHNMNYWQFGDYIGIGAGAHGKITLPDGEIIRNRKYLSPHIYQQKKGQGKNPYQNTQSTIEKKEQPFEFMMNALRLKQGVPRRYLDNRTQLSQGNIALTVDELIAQGLLKHDEKNYATTEKGFLFLNDVITAFLS